MKIFVPDTNLLLHGKFITEIKWNEVFENEEITVFIPFTVIRELDKAKYSNNVNRRKRARKLISFFKRFDRDNNIIDVQLIISHKKINWETVSEKYRKVLDETESDHQILVEIIQNFYDQLKIVYLVTADYTLLKTALELGIRGIDWFEEEKYKEIFTLEEKKEKSLPDLCIYFDSQMSTELSLSKITKEPKLLTQDDLIEPDVLYDMNWVLLNLDTIGNLLESYNIQTKLINNHQVIDLFLYNHCNHPYNDIDFYITTTLEKSFVITIKELIKEPIVPFIPELDVKYLSGIPKIPNEGIYHTEGKRATKLLNLDMNIEVEEKSRHNKWSVNYHIDRLKHNTFQELHPLFFYIPETYKYNKIQLNIAYSHKEGGTIQKQKRIINLP